MREFLVALNARFTSIIEKGLIKGTRSTISGNMGTEQKVNFGEHLSSLLRKKGPTMSFYREQGQGACIPPPLGGPQLYSIRKLRHY